MSLSRVLVKLLGNLGRKATGKSPFVSKPMIPAPPLKTPGMPGVASKSSAIDRINRMEESVPFERYNLPQSFYPKAEIRDRILQMRKDPGIAQGLGKMKGRAYSSLNQPGSVVAGTKRSFTNMLRADKNFEEFVVDSVGAENVSKVMNNSRVRKQLMLAYERMGAKGHPRTLGEFNEMDVGMSNPYSLS